MPASPSTVDFTSEDNIPVRIVRSTKRRKTISSQWRQDRLLIQVPAALDLKSERMLVDEMVKKFRNSRTNMDLGRNEGALMRRAQMLDAKYFEGRAHPTSVKWVRNQNKRWGSASLKKKTIRLSSHLLPTPQWVQDYVLVHELAHLVVPKDGHGRQFQELLNRFERRSEADQYLAGYATGLRVQAEAQGVIDSDFGGFDEDSNPA